MVTHFSTQASATIWKITLNDFGPQPVSVPAGAEFLCAREQHDEICVWFRCDPTAPKETRSLAVCATGGPAPGSEGRYLGTASLRGGGLIFHVFEPFPEAPAVTQTAA